jgi:lysozyme
MRRRMKTGDLGVELIKSYEGFSSIPYVCSGGKLTIGYGHVIKPVENLKKITKQIATELLKQDIYEAEKAVHNLVTVRLSNNQFSALVSFIYNLGYGNFKDSTLLTFVNANEHLNVPAEFIKWSYGGGEKLLGLMRRRLAESVLYLT